MIIFSIYLIGVAIAALFAMIITATVLREGGEYNLVTDTILMLIIIAISWFGVIMMFDEVSKSDLVTIRRKKKK